MILFATTAKYTPEIGFSIVYHSLEKLEYKL